MLSQKTKDFLNSLTPDEKAQLLKEMGFESPIPSPNTAIIQQEIEEWATGGKISAPAPVDEETKKIVDDIMGWASH